MVMVSRFVKIAFLLAAGAVCQICPVWAAEPSQTESVLSDNNQVQQATSEINGADNSLSSFENISENNNITVGTQTNVETFSNNDKSGSSSNLELPEAEGNLDSLLPSAPVEKTANQSSQSSKGQWKIGGKLELEYSNDEHPTIVNNDKGGCDTLMYETDKLLPLVELNAQYLKDDFKFYTKARYRFDKKKIELLDCYANIPLGEGQKVTLGRFKTRFGIEKSQSSSKYMTCNASAVTDSLYLGRNWGASFEFTNKSGDQLMLGVMNDHNEHRYTSADNDVFVRGIKRLSKHATLGASVLVGQHSIADSRSLPVQRFGLDYQLKTDNLRLDSEVIYSNGYNGLSETKSRALGWYVGSAYTASPSIDLVGFIDWYDPNLDICSNTLFDDDVNASMRYVIGVNYYFSRQKERRLMLNYEWKVPTEGPRIDSEGIYMRYSFEF